MAEEMHTDKSQNGLVLVSPKVLTLDTNVKVRARRPASSTYTEKMTNYMATLLRDG